MSSSKFIPGDDDNIESWMPPSVMGGEQDVDVNETAPLTAEQLEELQKEAYDEGFEQGKAEGFDFGHKEGLEQARGDAQALTNQFDQLMQTLESPLKILDDQVEQSLVDLVISMVRQLVRREMKIDPGQIIGVVREALSILPIASRNVRVVLHPEDAVMVRKVYEMTENEMGWEIIEDPVLARGGCRVVTETSQVDATLESRLAALIAPLLGDERETEAGSDQTEQGGS
ncbi:MAG: flagellar assembly protein FliH [Chromatiales bacterium]|nr:flagellar assembly protein FliH [Chromatiales bacterium]